MRDLHSGFIFILTEYLKARAGGNFGKKHPVWAAFSDVQKILEASDYIKKKKSPSLKVSWSVGQGSWAKIPWIALLDPRETSTTQKGVYCVYLFRQDMSGVYLCLAQGVTEPKNRLGLTGARNFLIAQAQTIRRQCSGLEKNGFQLDGKIDLHSDAGLGVDYEYSTIVYKFYDAKAVPGDNDILNDLNILLEAYDRYINQKTMMSKPGIVIMSAWTMQSTG
jgi:5-methylcytosine-specific restriction protein B